jgi:hypothetical protein
MGAACPTQCESASEKTLDPGNRKSWLYRDHGKNTPTASSREKRSNENKEVSPVPPSFLPVWHRRPTMGTRRGVGPKGTNTRVRMASAVARIEGTEMRDRRCTYKLWRPRAPLGQLDGKPSHSPRMVHGLWHQSYVALGARKADTAPRAKLWMTTVRILRHRIRSVPTTISDASGRYIPTK